MKKTPKPLLIIDILTAIGLVSSFSLVFFYAPVEQTMGLVQKVFYFHIATLWVGMLGFCLATVASIAYLRTRKLSWDSASVAGTEIGLVFVLIGIITGSIWARPIWNTWWTWDPRLTTTLIMELIYVAYFVFRANLPEIKQRARLSAIYEIAGFITVPLTFLSIRIFRSIHPVVIGGSSGMFAMSDRMLFTFMFALAAFSLFFVSVFWHRYIMECNQ
ncbi:MAG: cytochrome c biogenesis protein CcsA, partial [Anaerolineae bacterium]|nr:cytochrome c biogenesis protein CcsA [Anaerolineae bacterium]